MDFFKKPKYDIYDMFNVLIRNNELFDQNLQHITFLIYVYIFLKK